MIGYQRFLMKSGLLAYLCLLSAQSELFCQDTNESIPVGKAFDILAKAGAELTDAELEEVCRATQLTEVDLSGCQRITDQGMIFLARLPQLTSLSLENCHRITLEGIRAIAGSAKLERLDLSRTRMKLPEVYPILQSLPKLSHLVIRDVRGFESTGLEALTQLTYLDISNANGEIKDVDLKPLAALTSLRTLNLNGSRNWGRNKTLTDAGLKHLESLIELEFLGLFGHYQLTAKGYNPLFEKLTKLKTLEMGFNWPLKGTEIKLPDTLSSLDLMESFQLTDAGVLNLRETHRLKKLNLFYCLELTDKSLTRLRDMPQLRWLNLGCIAALTDEGLQNLVGTPKLNYLNLSDNDRFTDHGLENLSHLKALRELHLWSLPKLQGEGLVILKAMPELRTLNLADCDNLSDMALRHAGHCPSIRELYLDHCTKLTDEGIAHLKNLADLRELTLSGCLGLTDASLRTLAQFQSLEYLVVENCPGLTREGLDQLQAALPACDLIRD